MLHCPNCHGVLIRSLANPGVFWFCPACGGRSATIALLRRKTERGVVNALWQTAHEPQIPRNRRCLSCDARMSEVPIRLGMRVQKIDVCTRCQEVWFDQEEYAQLPVLPQQKSFMERLPPEARERYAMLELNAIQERANDSDAWDDGGVDQPWKVIPAFFRLPVELDAEAGDRVPLATWTLSALILAVSAVAFMDPQGSLQPLALVPSEFLRFGGLNLISSFFVHGGLFHLLANVYFLLVFGDNVEFRMGSVRFLVLVLLATLAGNLAHVIGNPDSTIPCVGASGGISGVITYYALAFPHAKLGFLFCFGFIFKWARIPAYALFMIWLATQLLTVQAQREGISNVSAIAHLGGVAVGLVFWLAERWKERPDPR